MGLPGSGAIGGSAIAFAVLLVALLAYELARYRTWEHWQVWGLLVPALACVWVEQSGRADFSWAFLTALISAGGAGLLYYLFIVSEREKNRR